MSATPESTLANPEQRIADLERQLAERKAELAECRAERDEALQRENATAEILQVINSSPGDLAPVFDAMLEKVLRLCDANFGQLMTFDGVGFLAAVWRGSELGPDRPPQTVPPHPGMALYRIVQGEGVVHIPDITNDEVYRSGNAARRRLADDYGARTAIWVALRKDSVLLGAFVIYRTEVRPFTDMQIALLENFATQAVIAMENARLLTETREALDQQTATAEVLQVINSSPGDLVPVFDAMLEKAMRLCDAAFGVMHKYDGGYFYPLALREVPAAYSKFLLREPLKFAPDTALGRIEAGEDVISSADAAVDYQQASPLVRTLQELGGIRSVVFVSLRKDGALLGVLVAYRQEPRAFSDKQIALLQNFAAQAVIAMENARLLTETREALEQQTATAEVLQVINSSPGDLAPVFDAILEEAHSFCGVEYGTLQLYDGEKFRILTRRGFPEGVGELWWREPYSIEANSPLRALLRGEPLAEIPDVIAYQAEEPNPRSEAAIAVGIRSVLFLPLRRDNLLLGAISAGRKAAGRFRAKEIALLQNFAAQAVIAMENARLLTETREALEQQTATAEVLQVINSSPGDLTPVFNTMLEKAMRLCEAGFGILWTYDGDCFHAATLRNVPAPYAEFLTRGSYQPESEGAHGRIIKGESLIHVVDVADTELYRSGGPLRRALVDLGGARSGIAVALRKDDTLLGMLGIYRQEVRPFSEKQIALLQNFAAQAVIAMENARLLDEIRQRQQELRVTFDNMVDGVAMFDETLHLAAWNRNFQELLQLPDEFLAQRPDLDTYIGYLVERGEFGETDPHTQIARLRAQIGEHYSFERVRPDRSVIEVRHNPMLGGGIVLIYSDITERKLSEAEIKAARDAAEAAYRDLKAAQASLIQAEKMASLGQLTAGIAHEIKNPLNFVNNFAGLGIELLDELKETAASAIFALDDEQRAEIDQTIEMLSGNLEKIAEHGRRADNIVTSMLEHSRGSSGECRRVDLNPLIEEALTLAYHGGRAQDQSFNITLERDYAEALAPIELVPQDITRVCLNLFGNGFYAAAKRQKEESDASFKPMLKVSTRDLGAAVEIRVRDNGIGIAPEIKDKLFQPFFTTKPAGEGTGLGLSISYDIVTQLHAGTITVDSRVGEFTEFTVRLPRAYRATTAS
jgi:two-component system, NtrC family, sensor kinase